MFSRDDAVTRADAWINGDRPADARLEVGVYEFELGFVVWGIAPAAADPAALPQTVGDARGVIDRESGELTVWPPLPAPAVAEQYSRSREAQTRFPADVSEALRAAGWRAERNVAAQVDPWIDRLTGGADPLAIFPAARAALAEFGGLRLEPDGAYPVSFHPTDHEPDLELFGGLAEILGRPVYPLAVRHDDGPSELTIDVDGRVFASHWAGSFFVGGTVDEAITRLVRGVGDSLPKVMSDGTFRSP